MKKQHLLKVLVGLLLLNLVGACCAWLFREEVEYIGTLFIERYGLWGIALGTLICDTSPLPLTNEPLALISLGAGIPFWTLIATMSCASHSAAPIGYTCGYILGRQPWITNWIQKKYPEAMDNGKKYATRAVVLGALLPIPYALTTWSAGMMKANFWHICWAGSLRWIKNLIAVGALAGGWMMGQS